MCSRFLRDGLLCDRELRASKCADAATIQLHCSAVRGEVELRLYVQRYVGERCVEQRLRVADVRRAPRGHKIAELCVEYLAQQVVAGAQVRLNRALRLLAALTVTDDPSV